MPMQLQENKGINSGVCGGGVGGGRKEGHINSMVYEKYVFEDKLTR